MNRRSFLRQSLAGTAVVGSGLSAVAQSPASIPPVTGKSTEPGRGKPFDVARVKEFVGAGHGNLPRVKAMLAEQPQLVLASYDWGSGDFETALGGAAHTGHREVALHLLEAGARIDAFAAAMLGEAEMVMSLVRGCPATAATRGPHGYSLLYHAGYSGRIDIAAAIAAHVKERARDFNQALHSAVAGGHIELVGWLLENGVDHVNTKNFAGKTPLEVAVQQNNDAIAQLLRTQRK